MTRSPCKLANMDRNRSGARLTKPIRSPSPGDPRTGLGSFLGPADGSWIFFGLTDQKPVPGRIETDQEPVPGRPADGSWIFFGLTDQEPVPGRPADGSWIFFGLTDQKPVPGRPADGSWIFFGLTDQEPVPGRPADGSWIFFGLTDQEPVPGRPADGSWIFGPRGRVLDFFWANRSGARPRADRNRSEAHQVRAQHEQSHLAAAVLHSNKRRTTFWHSDPSGK